MVTSHVLGIIWLSKVANDLPELIRDFVEICVANRPKVSTLTRELGNLFGARNLVTGSSPADNHALQPIWGNVLEAPQAFISYSHGDRPIVDALYEGLKELQVRLWLDRHELSAGDKIQQGVEAGLRKSDAIIVMLSAASAQSAWIQFEGALFYGRGSDRPIIPVVLDDAGRELAAKLPFLRDRLYVDLRDQSQLKLAVDTIAKGLI